MADPSNASARALLITGTDTGCGKTLVTAALVRLLRGQGHRVQVCKPVATGAAWVDGRWLSEDTRQLAEAGGVAAEQVTFWTFAEAAAPPVAARRAGQTLRLEAIARAVRGQFQPNTLTLIEGIGGLLCPLTDSATVADLAALLAVPLVVVARRSLGTLNHTLLTLEVARNRGLAVAGLVVTETTPLFGAAEETCVEELVRRIDVPLLAVIPHQSGQTRDIPETLAAVDWWERAGRVDTQEA
jgi:dethiobiotin synthetase